MQRAIYRRIQGERYTYQIKYDHAGYEVSRNGAIKKIGIVRNGPFDRLVDRREAAEVGLFCAELDIESLIGMEE